MTANNLEVAANKVVSTVRKSQAYAMASKGSATWGFCKMGNNIRLYSGSCSTPTHHEDFDVSKVTVSGLSDISFSGIPGKRGEPSQALTITISNDVGVKTVSINNAGGMTIN